MKELQPSDQRRYLRYELLDYVMTYVGDDTLGVRSVIADVGLGGLALRTRTPLAVGDKLRIHVGQGDRPNLVVKGAVRHFDYSQESGLYAIGVQFMPETHAERLAIAHYVNQVFQRQCDRSSA